MNGIFRGFTLTMLLFVGLTPLYAQNIIEVESVSTAPGAPVSMTVRLTNEGAIQGFQVALTFDNSALSLVGMETTGLDVETELAPESIEFFLTTIDNDIQPGVGWGAVAAIFDSQLPFNGQTLPAGVEQSILRYNFESSDDSQFIGACVDVQPENGFGPAPGINNVLTVSGSSVTPTMVGGQVCFIDLPVYIRGDANQDTIVNLADGIYGLQYLFANGPTPLCFDSADFNDDESLDISDFISLLNFQFQGGSAPTAPYPSCGVDPTSTGSLDCAIFSQCGTMNPAPTLTSVTPAMGSTAGGETITLAGTNFASNSMVLFDGNAATSVTFVDENHLQVVTPALSAAVVSVTVATNGGSATLPNSYTYLGSGPVLSSVSPNVGSTAGGELVILSGSNFTAASNVSFGGTPAAVTFLSSTQLRATAPAHAAGSVNVSVMDASGTSTMSGAFTYVDTPMLTSITPNSASPAGGVTVTLNGQNFTSSDSVSFGGTAATSVNLISESQLNVVVPAHAAGIVDVTVANVIGSFTLPGAFTYGASPTVSNVNPNNGAPLGGETITIFGSNFTGGESVTFGGTPASSIVNVSSSELMVVTPFHAPGVVDVVVTNANGSAVAAAAFTFNAAPQIAALAPNQGSPLGGTVVTVTGSNFTAGDVVTFGGSLAMVTTFVSDTQLLATAPARVPGVVSVAVFNSNGSATLAASFTYNAAPTLTNLGLNSGSPLGGDTVTLTGSGFDGSEVVTFGGTAAAISFVSSSRLTLVTPAHASGVVDVVLINGNGNATLANAFTFENAPNLVSVTPNSGTPLGGATVTLNGSDFNGNETVSFGGVNVAVNFVSATQLSVVTPAGSGSAHVIVSNENGSSTLLDAFTYLAPPTLSSVAPTHGSPAGGDTVAVLGSEFTADTAVTFGGVVATTTFVSENELSVITPAHSAGVVDVTVTNSNGSATLVNAFTFSLPPQVLAVTPASGSPLGGENVTVTGNNFTADMVVRFDGIAVLYTFVSANEVTAVTPTHSSGAVSVSVSNDFGLSSEDSLFTFNNPPSLGMVTPDNGSPLGGDSVTLLGSNFTSSTNVTLDGIPAVVSFVSEIELAVVTPPHAAGTVDIEVTNENGSSLLASAFTYNAAPALSSLSANSGTQLGGDLLTLSGSDFTATTSVAFGGIVIPANFVSTTQLTITTPVHAPGLVDVSVVNVNGASTLASAFTYIAAPVLTTVTPNQGTPFGGDTVTLIGINFTADSVVTFGGAPLEATFVNSTTLTVVTQFHAPGNVDVTVTNVNGTTTLANAYRFNSPPSLTALSAVVGPKEGGTLVTLTGANFTPGTFVTFDGVPASSVTFISESEIQLLTPTGSVGPADVRVTNINGSTSLAGSFTFN